MEEIWKEGYEGLYQIKVELEVWLGWNGRKYIKRVKNVKPI